MNTPTRTTTRAYGEGQEVSRDRGSNQAWMAALLSHELRTPLNAILGSISLLERESADSSREFVRVERTHIDRMRRNGRHLRAMVDGVLTLLRADADQLELSFTRARLHAALDDALTDVEMDACARNVTIVNTIGASTAERLAYWGDETYVRQILVNLLANAIKFTPGGRITVSAGGEEHGSPPVVDRTIPRIYVRVEDTGRGIPPCRLDRIFEPFQQAEAADRQRGAGLGLAISRQLAHAMRGEIEVTSQVGVGSVFTLWLPQCALPEHDNQHTR
jgi:signal transduction histidine kinase